MDGDELLFLKKDGNFVITDEFFVKPVPKDGSDFSLLSSNSVHLSNKIDFKRVTIAIQDQKMINKREGTWSSQELLAMFKKEPKRPLHQLIDYMSDEYQSP